MTVIAAAPPALFSATQSGGSAQDFPSRTARHRATPPRRHPLTAALAITAASSMALAPLHPLTGIHGASSSVVAAAPMPRVQLAAVISQRDIDALIANLEASLSHVTATVATVTGTPGRTLRDALTTAAALSDSFWEGLDTDNRLLNDVVKGLRTMSTGGLTRLAESIDEASSTVVVTVEQLGDLLASVLTGSLSTALSAVTGIVNDPLNAAKYVALINAPISIAGGIVDDAIGAVASVATNGVSLGVTFVTAATSQISNALAGVNSLIGAGKNLVPGNDLIAGVLTAVQGIVAAPINAAVAGVDGVAGAVRHVVTATVDSLSHGAATIVESWIGDGSTNGAIQQAIGAIGTAPLSPASYTEALGALFNAGIATGGAILHTAGSFASLPFSTAAHLTGTAASMLTSLVDGAATAVGGVLRAAGLPGILHGLPNVLALGVNAAINTTAAAIKAGLNAVAATLDLGSALSGHFLPSAASVAPMSLNVGSDISVTVDAAEASGDEAAHAESGSRADGEALPAGVSLGAVKGDSAEAGEDKLEEVQSEPVAAPGEAEVRPATSDLADTEAMPTPVEAVEAGDGKDSTSEDLAEVRQLPTESAAGGDTAIDAKTPSNTESTPVAPKAEPSGQSGHADGTTPRRSDTAAASRGDAESTRSDTDERSAAHRTRGGDDSEAAKVTERGSEQRGSADQPRGSAPTARVSESAARASERATRTDTETNKGE